MSDTQIPQVQRAWSVVTSGHPSKALRLQTDLPVPSKLTPGEVLVKIEAAALNPVGYKLMKMLPNWMAKRPFVAENDFAGIVVDANGTDYSIGDEVYGWFHTGLQQKTRQGSLAQYARVPITEIVKRPSSISAVEAAGLTLAGLTAYTGLVGDAKIEPGQSIFINGGSTSVGGFAIQIAKALGCKVAASCSAKNIDFVKSLGADEVFDYTKAPLHQQLTASAPTPKYHVLFDCAGVTAPELYTKSKAYLAPGGIFISVGPSVTSAGQILQVLQTACHAFLRPAWLGGVKSTWKVMLVVSNKPYLDAFAKLVAEGKVKPLVDSTYSFDDALKAYEKLMTGRAVGKVVVKID